MSTIICTNNVAPATALSLRGYDSTWIISGDSVYYDGLKVYHIYTHFILNKFKVL